jgi:negative regulator of replication initiation
MHSIKVDDEVFAMLQKHARPFVDSPNTALRRLLGLRVNGIVPGSTEEAENPLEDLYQEAMVSRRTKAPKASLKVLVQAGLLRNGERLYLVDYQGNRVGQNEATVSSALLEFKGHHHTMSSLAQELLKKVGFKSDSVRGPAHWVTAKNVSVKDLWQQMLDKRPKTK